MPFGMFLWLPLELFLGFIVILSGEKQGEMSLRRLVRTENRRPILHWFLLVFLGMTQAFICPPFLDKEAQVALPWLIYQAPRFFEVCVYMHMHTRKRQRETERDRQRGERLAEISPKRERVLEWGKHSDRTRS